MIYTVLTNKAMKFAYAAHEGQVDYSGLPYIFHPYHVAEGMPDEMTTCVALLHDVVEDTRYTLEDLAKEFPKEVVEAVDLLTHRKETPYLDYVRALKDNPIAKAVKLGDLEHNMDESRVVGICEVDHEKRMHWRDKYKGAMEILAG